jgi:hypothetical protein
MKHGKSYLFVKLSRFGTIFATVVKLKHLYILE